MGKLLLAAFFGGLFSAVLTFFLMSSIAPGDQRMAADERLTKAENTALVAEEKAEIVTKRLDLLTRRLDAATREHSKAVARIDEALASGGAAGGGDAPAGGVASDGSPYVSRAEMEAAIAKARTDGTLTAAPVPRVEAKTFEEIALDMGLTAGEEANVRQILRESEEEFVHCIFGDRPVEQVAADIKAAKDDPDKMQVLIGDAIGRGFRNAGKLVTLENRTKKKVENVLGKDKTKDLMARPRKPLLGDEFQRVFEDLD